MDDPDAVPDLDVQPFDRTRLNTLERALEKGPKFARAVAPEQLGIHLCVGGYLGHLGVPLRWTNAPDTP